MINCLLSALYYELHILKVRKYLIYLSDPGVGVYSQSNLTFMNILSLFVLICIHYRNYVQLLYAINIVIVHYTLQHSVES